MEQVNLDNINDLIQQENFEEAKELLTKLVAEDEHNIEALKLLGLCNVNLGLFSEGKKNFETVVKYKKDIRSGLT